MPIAEMAEGLFAGIDATAVTTCGTAVTELSKLYSTLGSAIDTAHQTLFSGDTSWSGSAATSGHTSMTNLSSSNGSMQSALNTIGTTLTAYGAALTPYQKKTYPTPIPGSRDPEAAADLAVVGLASAVAAAGIGTAVLQMMPIANPSSGQNTPPKPGATPHLTNHSTVPSIPNLHDPTHLASVPNLPFLGSTSPGLSNGLLPGALPGTGNPLLPPGLVGLGLGPGLGSEVAASEAAASEAGAAGEGMPMVPMAGGNQKAGNSERTRTIGFVEDEEFWSDNQPETVQSIIGAQQA